jgi:hypothetical protein
MVDLAIGLTAFNTMMNAAKALKDMKEDSVRLEASIDLQRQIFASQEDYAALLKTVSALETEIARFETWDRDKQRYELKDHGGNRVKAYALKDGVEPPELPHSICPDCYHQRKISIVQETRKAPGMSVVLECHVCGWEAYADGFWRPEHGGKKTRR